MKVVTAAQMRRIDEVTIRERGVSGLELMERAGREVAREILERFSPATAAILCGKGNNGGDGFVIARHLREAGMAVQVFSFFDPAELRSDAAAMFAKLPRDVEVIVKPAPEPLAVELRDFDVIVDAILGTGITGPVEGYLGEVIWSVNQSGVPIVAVDIPSGLSSEATQPSAVSIRAAVTVTIGLPKIGLVIDPGMRSAGVVSIVDIGFPGDLLHSHELTVNIVGMDDARAMIPKRDPAGHKGSFGKAAILAGSEGMTGAAVLAARAAGRSGVGLIYSVYPRALGSIMESHLIEPVKRPLDGLDKWFTREMIESAMSELADKDAVAFGPGIGQREETKAFALEMISRVATPMVIDADALNILAASEDMPAKLRSRKAATILTPHPGEAARLLKCSIEEIEGNRMDCCVELARETGAIIVLKGSQTIITAPDGQRYINPTGNSGLAKGGSGDVLTGLIVGLLAQGMTGLNAALLGVFVHGVAADLTAERIPPRAMTPSDVIEGMAGAWKSIDHSTHN